MGYANPVLTSSANAAWQSPDVVLECVWNVNRISLDPCTVESNPVNAQDQWWWSPDFDGLAAEWTRPDDNGLTYVNPPYGRPLPAWINKCAIEGASGAEIVLLVPARVDTAWYAQACNTSRARCEWRGRLTFRGAPHAAPFPSALFYWGPSPWLFCHAFSSKGRVQVMR